MLLILIDSRPAILATQLPALKLVDFGAADLDGVEALAGQLGHEMDGVEALVVKEDRPPSLPKATMSKEGFRAMC